jgi:hypothetical protein
MQLHNPVQGRAAERTSGINQRLAEAEANGGRMTAVAVRRRDASS